MKIYFHYCSFGFSNCYILGHDDPGNKKSIIVDPGSMDDKIIKHIEDNEYIPVGVLITHGDLNHSRGLRTLKRIYDAEVFCINPVLREHRTKVVRDGDTVAIGPFSTEVIAVPGHSADSAVFKIGRILFTGDALSAGLVGRTANVYAAANQMTALRSKILSLPGDYTILPGHGPPTTLEAERLFNAGINTFKDRSQKSEKFRLEI